MAIALRTRIMATKRWFTIDHSSRARCEVLATCGAPTEPQSPDTCSRWLTGCLSLCPGMYSGCFASGDWQDNGLTIFNYQPS